jgi:hypothetical protein
MSSVLTYKLTGWFSAVFCLWSISLEGPVVVCQHNSAALALVSLFLVGNMLVKVFLILVTDGAKVFREEVQVWV